MNLSLFETFVKVVETKNLSRAAEELNLSQPAVSKQIQTLEEIYGVLLLERSGRRLRTTEAGEALYHCARDIIRVLEKTKAIMEEMNDTGVGNLYLGASSIPGQYLLPATIKAFKEKNPQISVFLEVADTEKITSRVASREIDLGVVGAPVSNRKLESFPWLEDHLVLVTPVGHPLARHKLVKVQDLAEYPWVFRERGSGTRQLMEEVLAEAGLRRENLLVVAELGSTEAVLAAVETGMGISLLSNWAAERAATSGQISLVEIDSERHQRSFYVIFPRQKNRRPSVQLFIEHLKSLTGNSDGKTVFK